MALLSALKAVVSAPIRSLETGVKKVVTKIPDNAKSYLSTYDQAANLLGKDVAKRLLPDAASGVSHNAAGAMARQHNAGAVRMQPIRDKLDQLSGMETFWSRTVNRKAGIAKRTKLQSDAFNWIQQEHHLETMGVPSRGAHPDPSVEALVSTIRNSGFSRQTLDAMKEAGMDVSKIRASDNYLPVRHDGYKYEAFIKGDLQTKHAVADLVGDQISRMYPALGKGILTARQLGMSFLKTQKDSISKNSNVNFQGTTKEQLTTILEDAGLDPVAVQHVLNATTPNMKEAGKATPLKNRISWDMEATGVAPDGRIFKMGDFMDTNIEGLLNGYNNTTSARMGLAAVGITEKSQLSDLLRAGRDKNISEVTAHTRDNKFLDNLENELLGRSSGDQPHALMRAGTTWAQLLMLRNSGLYNAMEIVNTAQKFGWARTMKAFIPSMKGMWSNTPVTIGAAETITEMLRVELHTEGRMHSVVTHLESNYTVPGTWGNEMVQQGQQTVQFINLSEPIRKSHINLITGILGDLMTEFGKDGAQATKYFDELGLEAGELAEIKTSIQQHGGYTQKWSNQPLANKLAAVMMASIDETAFMARKGNTPSWLAYSEVGKLMLPFFTFTAAANNKILRRHYRKDGVSGVAINMAHYAPLAVVAAMASNVLAGKEPTDDLIGKAINIIPTLGFGSVPISFMNRGEMGGTPTPYAAINSTAKLIGAVGSGDIKTAMQNIPGMAILPGAGLIGSIFKEE